MKLADKKRIERLEAAILPKPTRPMLRIIERRVNDKGELLDADGKPIETDERPIMIMSRPGERAIPDVVTIDKNFLPSLRTKDTSQDVLYIDIVDTHAHAQDHPVDTLVQDGDGEPTDDQLEGAIAELERRLAEAKHGKNKNP